MVLHHINILFQTFKLNGTPTTSNNSAIFNGTSTVTMKEGPVKEVPTSITFIDESAVSIKI